MTCSPRSSSLTLLAALACAAVPLSFGAAGCGGGQAAGGPASPSGDERAMSEEEVDRAAAQLEDPSREAWQRPDEVVEHLRVEPGMTVVDLGVGTGYFLGRLSQAVGADGRVLGLDVEPAFVRRSRGRCELDSLHNVEVREVAADDPGLDGGSVDRVLVVDTWHAIEARTDYARRLSAALREGGELLIVDVTEDSPHGPPEGQRLVSHQVVTELQHAGFDAEVLTTTLPHQFVVRATRR